MKKINYGVVLIIILIIFLTLIVFRYNEIDKKDKKNIQKTCVDYLYLHSRLSMLDEEYRDINKVISDKEYNNYLNKVKYEISQYVVNEKVDYIFEKYKKSLDLQLDGKYILKKYENVFIDIQEFSSDGTYIYVCLNIIKKIEKDNRLLALKNEKNGRYEGDITSTTINDKSLSWLVLKKEDGNYKVFIDNISNINFDYIP